MLEVIVFVCGASLMGLEFIAARMLAPALGSSLFVWGSVVSIVMVALSIGYWFGGQIADRYGTTRTLSPVIAGAGLFTMVIPGLTALVLPQVAGLGARTGSLLASAVVFFLPALLLAMVSPLGVRLAAGTRVEHIGRSAGELYAISTAGSIAGTIATAFWLIPLLSLDGLVIGIGFVLFLAAALASTLPRRYEELAPSADAAQGTRGSASRRYLVAVTVACLVLGGLIGVLTLVSPEAARTSDAPGENVLYRKDTQYHRLIVTEDGTERVLRFDRSRQSAMYLNDPFETSFKYPNYLHLSMALKPDAKRVLIVGLGGGSLVKRMWRDYPAVEIDAVEIDPEVVEVGYRYFEMPRDERIDVVVEDGRRFLWKTGESYDIIVMDAYHADALPSHLTTEEFFEEARSHLNPGGVVAYNVIGSVEGDRSRLFRSMYRTAGRVWNNLWVFPIGLGTDGSLDANRNIIMLATDNRVTRQELEARIANRVGGRVTVPGFEDYGADLFTERVPVDDVPVLTDQYAPTDSLIEVN
jgi:spermidine synthase